MPSYIPLSGGPIASLGTTASLSLIVDSNVQANAARLYGAIADSLLYSASDIPQFFFGVAEPLQFYDAHEYTLALTTTCLKQFSGNALMRVYLTGSAFPSTMDRYGYQIGEFETDAEFRRFDSSSFTFAALADGQAQLRFVVYSGQWNVGDLTLTYATEQGFNPDRGRALIPVNTSVRRYSRVFLTSKLFDGVFSQINAPLTTGIFSLTGSNTYIVGRDNRVDGTIKIHSNEPTFDPDRGIIITTDGYTGSNGVTSSNSPAIYIGRGFAASSSTPFFVGSGSDGITFFIGSTDPEPSGVPNWSGSSSSSYLLYRDNQLSLATPEFNINSPTFKLTSVGFGSASWGSASSYTQGTGVWIDGTGNFRAGTDTLIPNATFIRFSSGSGLQVQGQVSVTDPASVNPNAFVDIKQVIANYIAFGPFGFYMSNL